MDAEIKHRNSDKTFKFVTPPADSSIEVLNDFYWTDTDEPHVARRKMILQKYPEVTKLTGHEPKTKWYVMGVVLLQLGIAYYLRHTPVFSWKFLTLAYVIGATANQAIFLAIHELSHNLLFRKPLHNKLFAVFANIPIGVPYWPRSSHTTSCTTSFLVTCTWILICLLNMKGGFVEHAWQVVLRYSRFSFMR